MPEKKCSHCGAALQEGQVFCPYCGAKAGGETNSEKTEGKKKTGGKAKWLIVGLVVIILLAFGAKFVMQRSPVFVGKQEPFTPSPDLTVVGTTKCDNLGRNNGLLVVVQNTGTQTIRDYEVVCVGFDHNGNNVPLDRDKIYDTFTFSSANLLPDDVYGDDKMQIGLDYSNIAYIEATVSSITFMDGTTWNASGIDSWANDVAEQFSVDAAKQKIEDMKDESNKAENCPHIRIISSKKYSGSRVSSRDSFDIECKNISDRTIREVEFYVLGYDQNGYAAAVNLSDLKANLRVGSTEFALTPGNTMITTFDFFFEENVKQYAVIIHKLEFDDGSVWKNPYTFQWLEYNEDMR